ncbi:MAG TPA: hypothetical protein VH114_02055 [Candidatus Acidoferrum sp.]|nr:hypothetical protein [Candidatus Acidoferrum sp.]
MKRNLQGGKEPRMQMVKSKGVLLVLVVGTGALALFLGIRTWRTLKKPIPPLEFPERALSEEERQLMLGLRTVPVPDAVRVHLLDGDFKIVRHMKEIPSSCRSIFESSFVMTLGLHAKPGEITLADPGEAFQASDSIVPGLPFRRLEFAGVGATNCFIHFQSGGKPSSFCLSVMDYANHKVIWVGEYYKAARSVGELRRMFQRRLFRDCVGLAC